MPTIRDNPNAMDYRKESISKATRETFPVHDRILAAACWILGFTSHGVSVVCGWHHDPHTGEVLERNPGEMIALMHSELSEALEGIRKGKMDDHLPHRLSVEVELADLLHRVFDFAALHNLDIGGAYMEKARYNLTREDHKPENRVQQGGKTF